MPVILLSNLEPVCCFMSNSNCCFLTCIQVSQEAGKVWCSHLFKNFPQFVVIHAVKGYSQWNRTKYFSEILLLFLWSSGCWQFWSLVPLPFLNPTCTSGSSQFMYWWSLAWRILSMTLLMWDECNCVVVWAFFGTAFLWNWNENRPFPVLWELLSFPNLLAYWVQHFDNIIF